jgi:hypothetical protein
VVPLRLDSRIKFVFPYPTVFVYVGFATANMKNCRAKTGGKFTLESEFPDVNEVPLKETAGIPLMVLEYPGP